MSETYENSSFYEALSGTTDNELGIPFITKGTGLDWYATYMKMLYTLRNSFFPAGQLRVYKDGDLTVGVYAGKWLNGNAEVSYSGSSSNALTDNATNYVYLTADGTLTINATGYPDPIITSHIRLARVVTSSGAITNIYDDRAYNLWAFAGSGGICRYSLSGTTTDATETEIFVNGVADSRITIASGYCYTFMVQISAKRTETSMECAGYKIEGVIKNDSGTTSLVDAPTVTSIAEDDSNWDVTAEADDINDALVIKVTGAASKTINWAATVNLTEVN